MKEGIGIKEGAIVVITTEDIVIVADVTKRELVRIDGEAVSGIEHNQVLNLSDGGERWEGDVDDNEPYGWGVLYDDEGEKRYEDFALEVRICFMVLCITLIFRRLSMKGIGVQESDGEEVSFMIEMGEWCTTESGSMMLIWK